VGVSVRQQIDGAPAGVGGAGTAGRPRLGFPWRRVALAVVVAAVAGAVVALVVPGSSSPSHHAVARTVSVRVPGAERPRRKAVQPPHKTELAAARPVAEVRDPEEAKSFPVSGPVHHSSAATPARAAEEYVAPGAQSNAEVRAELNRMHQVESAARAQAQATVATVPGGDSVGGNGTIPIPAGIPEVVQRVIAGANAITDFPYVYGGGHASFVSNSYDCSGSVSYALAAGGLLSAPETSGQLESWGEAGPGKWITIYANAGHVYMYVNVGGRWMRFDTVGRSGPYASRWQPEIRSNAGFVARHPPAL
jgi:cell wall-associated NlpC family hydrolase